MKPWIDVVGEGHAEGVFTELEEKLNEVVRRERGLKLSVPLVCFRYRKG